MVIHGKKSHVKKAVAMQATIPRNAAGLALVAETDLRQPNRKYIHRPSYLNMTIAMSRWRRVLFRLVLAEVTGKV
jgi:hypothetical protein